MGALYLLAHCEDVEAHQVGLRGRLLLLVVHVETVNLGHDIAAVVGTPQHPLVVVVEHFLLDVLEQP